MESEEIQRLRKMFQGAEIVDPDENESLIRNLRSVIKRKALHLFIPRSGKDRRVAYFSMVENDQRSGYDRRINA